MNSFTDLLKCGMGRAVVFMGEPISIDGKMVGADGLPLLAIVSALRVTREMAEAGYDPGYNLQAVISLAQMPTLPPTDQRPVSAVYKGRTYRLKDPSMIDAAGVTLYLQNNF